MSRNSNINVSKMTFNSFSMLCVVSGFLISGPFHASASSSQPLAELGWQEKSFSGNTLYTLEHVDNTKIIKGETVGEASALVMNKKIDVSRTPFLNWQWKVSNTYDNPKEKLKSGDDFPARIYVVYQRGYFRWNTVAINYVWSSQHAVGESWDNAHNSKSRIVVVHSGAPVGDTWVFEKRNIRDDFKEHFGVDVKNLTGYAIMVDGDNTNSSGTGWFRNIAFTEG